MIATLQKRRAEANEAGFTLIELLIVIVILGVLAGIVVFAVGGINDNSKDSACKAEKKTVETAVEAYYAQSSPHDYPSGASSAARIAVLTNPAKPILREAPSDPSVQISDDNGTVVGC